MKKLTVKQAAEIISKSTGESVKKISKSLYSKRDHGMKSEIENGRIMITMEAIENYKLEHKQGRPPRRDK